MKNFKKIIILSIIILIVIIYLIYNSKNNSIEDVEEDIFIETSEETVETNTIILHITGEVNSPRYYKN